MTNPFLETYNSKTTNDLLDILKKVKHDTSNVGKMELEAIVTILDTRKLSLLESEEYDQIFEHQGREMESELSNQSNTKEEFGASTSNHTAPPIVEQPYSNRQNTESFEKAFEAERDKTSEILTNSNPINHGTTYHQYMPNEVELFKSDDNSLILTSHRLFYQNSSTTIALTVDEISFIGYKRKINYLLLILGVSILIIGLGSLSISKYGLIVLVISALLIYASIKKYVVFATAGGEMVIEGNFNNLRAWIDKVFMAKENLIKQRKFS
jgi:hypothetical protein